MSKIIRYVCRTHPNVTLFIREVKLEPEKVVSNVAPLRWCPECERAYHSWECDILEEA